MYCCHVNNIAYLQKNHRTNAQDMRNIIESLSPEDRKKYDYDLLEEKYIENQNRIVDDANALEQLENILKERPVLLIAPGLSSQLEKDKINAYIAENNPVVIGVNAVNQAYKFDYLFITNKVRYDYAKEIYPEEFMPAKKLLLSNIKTEPDENEIIINFNRVIKRGWEHFDNAVICVLRLLDRVHAEQVAIAGFDGFKHQYNESYADASLPTLNPENRWDELNEEIKEMFRDFKETTGDTMNINFITESIFNN
jgi:4-hydroxy 2-oxovalerate aldolase